MTTNWKILLGAGLAAVFAFALFLKPANDETGQPPAAVVPAPVTQNQPPVEVQPVVPPAPPEPTAEIDLAELANDPAIADAPEFNDANYLEPVDDLLVIEQGDPTRYITPQSRAEDLARRQRVREDSLRAESLVGDERIRAMTTLGAYAGDGNDEAAAKMRELLTSKDDELRADALDAVAELLPRSDAVPAFSAEPLSDEQVDLIFEALQDRSGS